MKWWNKNPAVVLAVLLLAVGFQASAEDKTPSDLVRQLGDADFEVRQKAGEELRGLGYAARNEVKDAISSPDPETRERAKELWKSLRWMVFAPQIQLF